MYYFIVNPGSRSGRGKAVWQIVEGILEREQVEYRVFFTAYRYHATKLAREITSQKEKLTLVTVGGDGTVNEVVDGIQDFSRVTFGYIPTGSSNDFARGMALSHDPHTALKHILVPSRYTYLSVGTVTYETKSRRFAVSSGFGFDAEVCCRISISRIKAFFNKFSLGKFSYVSVAVQSLLLQAPKRMVITMDDKMPIVFEKVYFAAAMNQKYEGGGFMFCPKAVPTDDFLDIIVAEGLSKLKILCLLPTAFSGKHTRFSGIHVYRCKKAVMESEIPLPFHTDGEPISLQRRISTSLEPQKIRFIIS